MRTHLLDIQNVYNYRDIGGYRTSDGHMVKWNKVVRAGNLATLSTRDQAYLINYGIKTDVDLRSKMEQVKAPDRISHGIQYHFYPIFDSRFIESQSMYAKDPLFTYHSMIKTYQFLVTNPNAQHGYQNLFKHLLNNDGSKALLFHCSQGKDRTGIGAAILLLLLGVDLQIVKKDYMISKKIMVPYIAMKLKRLESEHVNYNVKLNIRDMFTVHEAYFNAAMQTMKEQYSNLRNFAHQFLNLDDQDIDKLKQLYLTD